jgi:hypothetical protein
MKHERELLDKQIYLLKEKLSELEMQVENNDHLIERLDAEQKKLEENKDQLIVTEYQNEILIETKKKKKVTHLPLFLIPRNGSTT